MSNSLSKVTKTAGRKILVVDDQVDAAETLAMLLRLEGHEVEVAHSGNDALAAIAAFNPSMVFLDIGLPDMNGYEVGKQIRQRTPSAEVFLVALTGYGEAEDRQLSADAGFDYHLVKPATLAALNEILKLQRGLKAPSAKAKNRD